MRAFVSLIIYLFLLLPQPVSAHSGRTDAWGYHNCYTSYCAGEYHCHGGGSGGGGSSGGTSHLIPVNPKNAELTHTISNENWCNYDLTMSWDKPLLATKFSIATSKYAGADPGPLADTMTPSYTFKNLPSGQRYVNLKSGNSYGWGAVSYWTVDLPQPPSSLHAELLTQEEGTYLKYDISCLEKVEGPQEFIDHLNAHNNAPSGVVRLSYSEPTTINIKGWDDEGKEYSQTLAYTPTGMPINAASTEPNWELFGLLAFIGGAFGWGILTSIWQKLTKKHTHKA
jgi:hypothetical protein